MSEQAPRAKLILEAAISPSEDQSKVAMALERIVGDVEAESSSDGQAVKLVTKDPRALNRLRDQLRDRQIRAAARRQLLANIAGNAATLMLNRQAAVVGTTAICGSPEESPLGPIYLTLEAERVLGVIDYLTSYDEG